MKKTFAVILTLLILSVVGTSQFTKGKPTAYDSDGNPVCLLKTDTCCPLTLQEVIWNDNHLVGDNTIYSSDMVNLVVFDDTRELNIKALNGSLVTTATNYENETQSKHTVSSTGIISMSAKNLNASNATTFTVYPNMMRVYSQDTTFSGIKEQVSYSANRCPTCYVTLDELNAKKGVAVADAVDSSDVVVKFNLLLQSLRDAGLIEE